MEDPGDRPQNFRGGEGLDSNLASPGWRRQTLTLINNFAESSSEIILSCARLSVLSTKLASNVLGNLTNAYIKRELVIYSFSRYICLRAKSVLWPDAESWSSSGTYETFSYLSRVSICFGSLESFLSSNRSYGYGRHCNMLRWLWIDDHGQERTF